MHRNLPSDLKHLSTLAFRRSFHCADLLKRFHALKKQIAATAHPDLIWNIYDWLLVPLSLWPLDFEGLSSHLLAALEGGKDAVLGVPDFPCGSSSIQNQKSKIKNGFTLQSAISLLQLIDPPPLPETQSIVASFEHDIESGRYEKMLKQAAKFDEQEKALLQNQQLAAEWAELKRLFDIKQFQNSRGVIRRRMSQERGFRDPSWQFHWPSSSDPCPSVSIRGSSPSASPIPGKDADGKPTFGPSVPNSFSMPGKDAHGTPTFGPSVPNSFSMPGKDAVPSVPNSFSIPGKDAVPSVPNPSPIKNLFHFFFDAFCYRWKLYGMEHDRPLLLKISVNPTPHGTMIVIPRHWSLDPRRDLDWSLINRLHRSRGAKKQGPKLSSARIEKLDEAKKVRAAWEAGRKKGLKGEALHDFMCAATKHDPRSDSSWWKRLLKDQKSQIKNQK